MAKVQSGRRTSVTATNFHKYLVSIPFRANALDGDEDLIDNHKHPESPMTGHEASGSPSWYSYPASIKIRI